MSPALPSGKLRPQQWSLWIGLTLTAMIALVNALLPSASLSFLYMVPIILVGGSAPLWGVLLLVTVCVGLARLLGPNTDASAALERIVIQASTFLIAGLLASRIERNRRRTERQFEELRQQIALRKEAEEQLNGVIDTSVTAIVTADETGTILLANRSAHRLFGQADGETLKGASLSKYLPFLSSSFSGKGTPLLLHTMIEGRANKKDGSVFYAQVWASNYKTTLGFRTAVIAWDASEQRREYEELGLRQLMTSSSILTGAVAHEVRNLSAAISAHYHQLALAPGFAENPNARALGTLVESLRDFASAELKSVSGSNLTEIDLNQLLEDVAFVIEPWTEGVKLTWEIAASLPHIRADRSALLQVLLNLINNAQRASQQSDDAQVIVTAYELADRVVVRISNNGPQIESTDTLFQPFQAKATATGLGLYVSRAIVRTFGGELRYANHNGWNVFLVELSPAGRGVRQSVAS